MNLPSLTEISGKAQNAFKRFPITLIWAISGTIFTIFVSDNPGNENTHNETNIILTFILGVSWLIGAQFFIEQWKKPKQGPILKTGLLVLLLIFYWHLPSIDISNDDPKYIIRFFLFLIAGHLFVFFGPFLFKWNKIAYWNYLKTVAFAIARSGLFSGVLYLGLALALAAIDALFEVRVDSDTYFQLFIFCVGIVNTWIYLSDFPKNIHESAEIHFNKALEVFVKYILIPLVSLYVVILYAYGFKILIQWELPKGWVSYLVTALALLGFVVQVIINPIQKSTKSWAIYQFHPWIYRLLLPLIALLFVAIFRRVADYGITENRYFVLVIAFWILGMTLFLLFSKKKSLIILPLSLFILAIVSSFGFWGASSVSQKSQANQFRNVFEAVTQSAKVATKEQHEQLISILRYLDKREVVQDLDEVTGIKIKEIFKSPETTNEKDDYFDARKVLDSLGISIDSKTTELDESSQRYFNFYLNQNEMRYYDIRNFDSMALIFLNDYKERKIEVDEFEIYYDKQSTELQILSTKDGRQLIVLPMFEYLSELRKLGNNSYDVDEEKMTITAENDSISVKFIISEISFSMKGDYLKLNNGKAMLLLKHN